MRKSTFVAPDSRVDSRTGLDDVCAPTGRRGDALVADAALGFAGLGLFRAKGVWPGGRRRILSDGGRRYACGRGDVTRRQRTLLLYKFWGTCIVPSRRVRARSLQRSTGPGPVRRVGKASERRAR